MSPGNRLTSSAKRTFGLACLVASFVACSGKDRSTHHSGSDLPSVESTGPAAAGSPAAPTDSSAASSAGDLSTTAPSVPPEDVQVEGGPGFRAWVEALRREAAARGIRAETLDATLSDIQPIPRVIELDRAQPEFSMTFQEYLTKVVRGERIAEGRRLLAHHRALLDSVEARSGVPAEIVVALWGIESSFGTKLGTFHVIPALATLAYDGRRSKFFRGELLHALRIVDDGHIGADEMLGSWAGAMGQCQFMPSSFVNFAVDGDGDGRANIWGSTPDVFASAANYLAKSGWTRGQRWGTEVRLPSKFDASLLGMKVRRSASDWHRLGVRAPSGGELPREPDLFGSIVRPDEKGARAYFVNDNYGVIMRWNRSTFFATAVGLLSDGIAGR